MNRRKFFKAGAATAAGTALIGRSPNTIASTPFTPQQNIRHNPIGVSTYSFWQFNGPSEENSYLQNLKKRAFHSGLDLMGFSTHQGFLNPEKEYRDSNIEKTIHQIELAYSLGIPTMRLNTGRWGTTESFDKLMENRGIEPSIEGYTEEDGFKWSHSIMNYKRSI